MGEKCDKLDFRQTIICPCCGRYGSLEVYMEYTYFSMFFIPIANWRKRYFVKTTCCGSICEIDSELGKAIEKGTQRELDLGSLNFQKRQGGTLRCSGCGFVTSEDFVFCPKCGRKF
ncbi:MAG TPA: zinc ribbon domain-containing protein [Clostridiales bacterium]|nr:zinc ribbon domain-containing protein [Clostridiales bacterium]